ncbi:MAG TPA: DNA recombination protein RmuC [Longimicrobiales bacterium]|nr:DNA recombination protein RmuC [Longimicrobiales bacterium]
MGSAATIVLVVAAVAIALVALLEVRRSAASAAEPVRRLEARLQDLTAHLGGRIEDSAQAARGLTGLVDGRMRDAGRTLAEVQTQLARLDEATRQVESVGRSIAGLEKMLAAPKLRGGLGEWTLEHLLSEVLPADRVLRQHALPSRGTVVDFAVRAAEGRLICIDSKFPLESFQRLLEAREAGAGTSTETSARRELRAAVRGRLDEIAERYICPADGTLDFAFMFVPSEAIYYELAVREADGGRFLAYARERRVVPCSPNTLYAYLQAVLLGLKGVRVAERAGLLHRTLEHLRTDVARSRGLLDRAARQFRHAGQNLDEVGTALGDLERRLDTSLALEDGPSLGPVVAEGRSTEGDAGRAESPRLPPDAGAVGPERGPDAAGDPPSAPGR